jgi:hypothetical protein
MRLYRLSFIGILFFCLSACSLSDSALSVYESATISVIERTETPRSTDQSTITPLVKKETTPEPSVLIETSPEPQHCNLAAPGLPFDITVPDGTNFRPNEVFSKTWRLINNGTCPWTRKYSTVWFSGTSLGANQSEYLGAEVLPGGSIDITLDMIAPNRPGTYQANWKLRSEDGKLFGIGPNGDAPFWVSVDVIDIRTVSSTISPTLTPTSIIYTTGKAVLSLDEGLDLDGSGSKDAKEIDLIFQRGDDKKYQLKPINSAGLIIFSMNLPTERECRTIALSQQPVIVDNLSDGVYLCYRTQMGLSGYARLTKIDIEDHTVSLEYLTWAVP